MEIKIKAWKERRKKRKIRLGHENDTRNEKKIESSDIEKSETLPPPHKKLEELKSPILQFRSILRISNVSIDEFLDSIIFKDKKDTVSYLNFKIKTEAVFKNHTSDFSSYIFNLKPKLTRPELKEALSKVYYELEDY